MRTAPIGAPRFKSLVMREWHYLKGLGGVALLDEVCPCGRVGDSVEVSKIPFQAQSLSLPAACVTRWQDFHLLSQHHVCLPALAMLLAMMIMDEDSDTVSQSQLKTSFYKSCHGHGVSSQQ